MHTHETICFAFPETTDDRWLADRDILYPILRQHDLEPHISLNGQSAFAGHNVELFKTDRQGELIPEGVHNLFLEDMSLVVNRSGQTLHITDPGIPVINDARVRAYGDNKLASNRDILEPLGLAT